MKDNIKTVRVEDSVGKVLMHDITSIVPGKFKGPVFKNGHIIEEKDIEKLKDSGKEKIYVFDISDNEYHEDEAANLFKRFAGENIITSEPSEGKVLFSSNTDGLVKIQKRMVNMINHIPDIVLTTIHSHIPVKKNDRIAGIRVIPLAVKKKNVEKALKYGSCPIISVAPFKEKKVGLIVTGSEVASNRIKDRFHPVIEKKIRKYKSNIHNFKIISDNAIKLKNEILKSVASGCNFIILTGGMSVDPDDVTKTAIRDANVKMVSYGAPVLPGNMFMAGYLNEIPVFGVPACALFYNITVLDLFLPYIFSDTRITKKDIINMGYGGFCRHCDICNFPNCGFGKC